MTYRVVLTTSAAFLLLSTGLQGEPISSRQFQRQIEQELRLLLGPIKNRITGMQRELAEAENTVESKTSVSRRLASGESPAQALVSDSIDRMAAETKRQQLERKLEKERKNLEALRLSFLRQKELSVRVELLLAQRALDSKISVQMNDRVREKLEKRRIELEERATNAQAFVEAMCRVNKRELGREYILTEGEVVQTANAQEDAQRIRRPPPARERPVPVGHSPKPRPPDIIVPEVVPPQVQVPMISR